MSTVLSLVDQALREVGASAIPSSLLSSDSNAKQALALVKAESRYLRSQKYFPQQKRTYTFSLEANRWKYPMPQDFYMTLKGTLWDNTNRWQLVGPLSDEEFLWRKKGYVSFQNRRAFRVIGPDGNPNTIGGQFEIDPVPGSGDTAELSYEYITKNIFLPPYWTPSTVIAAGSYRASSGYIYYTAAGGTTGTTPPSATTAIPADGTVTWTLYSQPYETILTDSDQSIFDDDVMISGIKWRYEKSKGVEMDINPQTGIPIIHEKLVANAVTRWNGDSVVSLQGPRLSLPVPSVPEGNWNV